MIKISRLSNDAEKPFHTHSYAEAANGNAIGSTNAESFHERHRREQNRKHIQRYRDSHVASGSHLRQELNKRLSDDTDVIGTQSGAQATPDRQAFNAGNKNPIDKAAKPPTPPRQQFREPPTRGYNPFH